MKLHALIEQIGELAVQPESRAKRGARIAGLIDVESQRVNAFDDRDRQTIEAFAPSPCTTAGSWKRTAHSLGVESGFGRTAFRLCF